MPWLGQPWRFTGPFWYPVTSTRCRTRPGRDVADFEAQQVVDVDVDARLRAR